MYIEKPYSDPVEKKQTMSLWLKKLGLAGFIFFLAKGLLWLVAFGALGIWGLES